MLHQDAELQHISFQSKPLFSSYSLEIFMAITARTGDICSAILTNGIVFEVRAVLSYRLLIP